MGVAFAVMASVCWGIYNIFVRRGRDEMDAGAGYLLTLLINVAATAAFTRLPLPGAEAPLTDRLALLFFVLAGFSTTLLGRTLYFESIFRIGPSRASAWKNASPMYTLLGGALFLGEVLPARTVAGVVITLAGMVLLGREQVASERAGTLGAAGGGGRFRLGGVGGEPRVGLLLGIASGLAFATGMLLRKAGLGGWADPAAGSAVGAASALLGWLPFSVWRGEVRTLVRTPFSRMKNFLLAGAASSLAQLLMFLSLRLTASAVTHTASSLEPIFTMLLGYLVFGGRENLSRGAVFAVGLMCCGVILVGL